jgi:putative (di)nucleoside polyphosphate hydrolase
MIDASGFRANVGIILVNHKAQVFWARRIGRDIWQFPQGGMTEKETPLQTLYRELHEEVGLKEGDVTILGRTRHWLRYRIPHRLVRNTQPVCIGQKQLWYLLRLEADESRVRFDSSHKPEFDNWEWVSYWYPLRQVVLFKREVYRRALRELAPYLFKNVLRSWGMRSPDHLLD